MEGTTTPTRASTQTHGATQDADVTFLFITNREFGIHFVGDTDDPDAPVAAS